MQLPGSSRASGCRAGIALLITLTFRWTHGEDAEIGFIAVNESDKIIQRSQLPLLGAYVEPRSATERRLVEIWRRALGMDRIGIRDNYEDLGGDSLMAASIIAELEASFGTKIPWALLADAGTIEQMAITIDDLKQGTK